MKKKILAVLMVVGCLITLSSCGKKNEIEQDVRIAVNTYFKQSFDKGSLSNIKQDSWEIVDIGYESSRRIIVTIAYDCTLDKCEQKYHLTLLAYDPVTGSIHSYVKG